MTDWLYRCLICDAKVNPSGWEAHLVSDHWLEYVRAVEPSRFFVDYVELSR